MFSEYFKQRKTVRKYQDKEIPLPELHSMLADAMRAPTTGNMQLYSAVITTRKDIKELLSPCHFNQPQICNAPAVITFCADFNRFIKWCEANHASHGYDNFQFLITAILDAAIFTQQFNTIAELNGLGCCYIGTTTYNAPQIAQVLDLPKFVIPVATLTVGYPDDSTPQVERLPIEAVIHDETYHDYTIERIKELHAEKENLEINRKFVSENKKETLAQVFTDIRYPKKNNELFSEIFYKFIEEQGFSFPDK